MGRKCPWMAERNRKYRTFKEKIKKNCNFCNIEFFVRPSNKDAKFCCRKCKDVSQIVKNSHSHNQKVYKELSKLFPQECMLCGTDDKLLVHHKDGNKFNNSLCNLSILCRGCHNRVHLRKSGKLVIISTPHS